MALGDFLVMMARASGETKVRSGSITRSYWFEEKDLRQGDLVVLYTKAVTRREKENASGTTSHFYYWGFESPAWTERYRPVLARAPGWQVFYGASAD